MKVVRLRQVREAKLMTRKELAILSGVAEITIARLESGKHEARFNTIRRLAAALDVDPPSLVGTSVDNNQHKTNGS